MQYNSLYAKECSVYPGGYIPLPEKQALLAELKISGKNSAALMVNMDEFTDCFKIEVTVPGIKREDIFVHVQGDILSIIVLLKDSLELKKNLKIHEYNAEHLERYIVLPPNADTEFVSAEHTQGMLKLCIPKTLKPPKNNVVQIVI